LLFLQEIISGGPLKSSITDRAAYKKTAADRVMPDCLESGLL
jgi:hypothetical protein